jgi:hypothetical protein
VTSGSIQPTEFAMVWQSTGSPKQISNHIYLPSLQAEMQTFMMDTEEVGLQQVLNITKTES